MQFDRWKRRDLITLLGGAGYNGINEWLGGTTPGLLVRFVQLAFM
jgi:hypothetical protein